jgi:heavy metal sensor kinase
MGLVYRNSAQPDARLVAADDALDGSRPPRDPLPPPEFRAPPAPDPPQWLTLAADGRRWRLVLFVTPERRLLVGADLAVVDESMRDVRNSFLLASPVALALFALGAWFLSDRALRPVRRLTASMRRISAQGLSERVAKAQEDREFEELIAVFNEMLARLERGFLQASRFSADAAHELKTPLAILQGEIERALNAVEPGSAIQRTLGDMLDEVRRLSGISRKLLLLAQADAGGLRLHRQPFDLSRALADLAEDARLLAPGIELRESIASGQQVRADADLLMQLLHNLLSNAIKYNVPGGWIEIAARAAGKNVEVAVSNSSRGIAATDRERIFDRFYRADPSRSRQRDGIGLGLALAREIARAHDGDLRLAASADGETRFVLTLPR